MSTLGDRLKQERSRLGLSKRELSIKAGLSPSHIGLIESGVRRELSAETVAALAAAIGCSMEWLWTGSEPG